MRSPFFLQRIVRANRRASAGFTLVELMVAMTGGLFLALAVFALSRDASRFYQQELRLANATLAGLSGFERLSADVARAGHLVTANIDADPHVCNRPQANWPAMLRSLRAVLIETDTSALNGTEVQEAGISPKGIVVAGALNMPEVLTTASVIQDGAGRWEISLDTATPAAARIGLSPDNTAMANNLAVLNATFMPGAVGRIVRLRKKGWDQYAVVSGVRAEQGPVTALALINLADTPAIVRPASGGTQCGIEGNGSRMDVSVIDLVRYDIRPMVNDLSYKALFKASGLGTGGGGSLPYEGKRAELVRVELNPEGVEIDATREIVGEYAVDLQIDPWGATGAADPTVIPIVASVNNTYASTQQLRGLHLRVSVRSREADRMSPVTGIAGGSAHDLYRIGLTLPATGEKVYARVRTFQSDIPLRNLENNTW
jgi:hypothetical protein